MEGYIQYNQISARKLHLDLKEWYKNISLMSYFMQNSKSYSLIWCIALKIFSQVNIYT